MTRVIFVRHGQTSWNHLKRYQGHSDIELNEAGMQQAQKVAQRLKRESISAVYSSDLIRAVQTAQMISKEHSLEPILVPELREINFGLWEGLTYEEIMAAWPDVLSEMYSKPGAVIAPDGESFYDVQKRTRMGIGNCLANHEEQTIVIVSHGGTIRTALCDALGLAVEKMWSLGQDSTAVTMIEYFGETKVVTLVNDTHHLQEV